MCAGIKSLSNHFQSFINSFNQSKDQPVKPKTQYLVFLLVRKVTYLEISYVLQCAQTKRPSKGGPYLVSGKDYLPFL